MIKLLRLLMIALLALAIPVQGVAAATMLYCGPDHGLGTDRAQAYQAAGPAQTHGTHQVHGHDLHAHAQPDAQDAGLTQLPDTPDQPAAKCSVCAACCNAAAIAAPVLLPSLPGAEPGPALKSSPLSYSFITDGPRRPPRSFLA